jgi:Plasmid encoded RepA protein
MDKLSAFLPKITFQRKRHLQLVKLAGDLAEQTREEAGALGFMSRLLIMVNLPYRDLGKEKKVWVRKNGKVSIVVSPAYDQNGESMGIPYGSYPRLILAYIITQAVKTSSPQIHLGKGFRDFIELIGLEKGGHQFRNVKKQLERVLSASFSWIYETDKMQSRTNIQVSHQSQLWWDTNIPDQKSLWESYIELNLNFFNEIMKNAVPLDLRVLNTLKNSPLGLDLYMFIAWRSFKLDKLAFISWGSLQEQLGTQHSELKEFARECKKHIKRIQSVCPTLKIAFPKGRLCLYPSYLL